VRQRRRYSNPAAPQPGGLVFIVFVLIAMMIVTALISCAPQPEVRVVTGPRGEVGSPGQDGIDGSNGQDGIDGKDGVNGQDGADAILEFIDPCGDNPNVIDEVVLRMADGRFLAFLAKNNGGTHGRLALLPPGNYVTTDETNCAFSISPEGEYVE
jgi:hypothetical protein